MLDLSKIQKIYFLGIGGIAMSSSAGIAKSKNFEVLGSDEKIYEPSLSVLKESNINFFEKFDVQNIKNSQADLFIISAGIDRENPEYKYIIENELSHCSFAEFMGALAQDNIRIVVTGTHGKTTTSGLIGTLLSDIDDSSYLIGGVLQGTNRNYKLGDGHYFVFEGDEYKNLPDDPTPKFHFYKADILVLTNLEYDHPDLFSSFDELKEEYELLLANLPPDGIVVYNGDDVELEKLIFQANRHAFSFGQSSGVNVRIISAETSVSGTTLNVVVKFSDKELKERYETKLFGAMNVLNALACITLLRSLGFTSELVAKYLTTFPGIKRRFELLGKKSGIDIIDDYAHHPTAVKETLKAARVRYPGHRIWAIFEPHTFSRTEALKTEMLGAFEDSDFALIAPIYAAREINTKSNSKQNHELVNEINSRNDSLGINNNIRAIDSKQEALEIIKNEARENDVIIVMAVGDFNLLGSEILEKI